VSAEVELEELVASAEMELLEDVASAELEELVASAEVELEELVASAEMELSEDEADEVVVVDEAVFDVLERLVEDCVDETELEELITPLLQEAAGTAMRL